MGQIGSDKFNTSKVILNISQDLLQEISGLLSRASRQYLRGNLIGSFYSLKAAKFRTYQSFSKEERDALLKKENEFVIALKKKDVKFISIYEQYNELLMGLLNDYDYLVRKARDSTKII